MSRSPRAVRIAITSFTLLAASCATPPPQGQQRSAAVMPAHNNPVFDTDFPDPAGLRAPDGYYYVYGTQGRVDGRMHNIQLIRSRDLVTWERLGDALPERPAWARSTQDFWAPDVVFRDGRYYLYYSAKPDVALTDDSRGLCLAVATATQPQGPFTDMGRPLQCGSSFINIDPMAFDDPATGRRLLYWGSGFGPIKVQELAPDRMSFAPGSSPIDLIPVNPSSDPANYERLVEGAWVHFRDGWYYLFYSGDNCCGPNAHYATLVARSRSATGPFQTMAAERGTGTNVVIEADDRWLAPGHNMVINDEAGRTWTLFHAVDRRRPQSTPQDAVNSRRVLLLRPIEWVDGWPQLRQ